MKFLIKTRFVFLVLLVNINTLMPQEMEQHSLSSFEKKVFPGTELQMPYRILLPEKYNPETKYPLVLFLHGSGERGNDNEKQLTHAASVFLDPEIRTQYPAIVVFPQCPVNDYWSNVDKTYDEKNKLQFSFRPDCAPTQAMKTLLQLLGFLPENYSIDASRVYVCGLSMGGMGTFEIVRRDPDRFAAAIAICGGAHPDTAKEIHKTAWWIFHGEDDPVVPVSHSKKMNTALKEKGADVTLTLYKEVLHDSWTPALAETKLFSWLFSKRKL